jgi:hypothetical protein
MADEMTKGNGSGSGGNSQRRISGRWVSHKSAEREVREFPRKLLNFLTNRGIVQKLSERNISKPNSQSFKMNGLSSTGGFQWNLTRQFKVEFFIIYY